MRVKLTIIKIIINNAFNTALNIHRFSVARITASISTLRLIHLSYLLSLSYILRQPHSIPSSKHASSSSSLLSQLSSVTPSLFHFSLFHKYFSSHFSSLTGLISRILGLFDGFNFLQRSLFCFNLSPELFISMSCH